MTRRLEVVVSWRVGQIYLHWVGSQCTQPLAKNVNTIRGRGERDGKNPESFELQEAKAMDEACEIAKTHSLSQNWSNPSPFFVSLESPNWLLWPNARRADGAWKNWEEHYDKVSKVSKMLDQGSTAISTVKKTAP